MDGPMKKPACIEKVSHPIDRPSRLLGTSAVIALNSAACWAPAAKPADDLPDVERETLVVAAIASCDPAATSDRERQQRPRAEAVDEDARRHGQQGGRQRGGREERADLKTVGSQLVRVERNGEAAGGESGERGAGGDVDRERSSRIRDTQAHGT